MFVSLYDPFDALFCVRTIRSIPYRYAHTQQSIDDEDDNVCECRLQRQATASITNYPQTTSSDFLDTDGFIAREKKRAHVILFRSH